MFQLIAAMVVMLVLAAGLAVAGVRLGRSRRQVIALMAGFLAVLVMLGHAIYLGDNLLLARLFPVRDVIVWGNVQPLATGLLAGLAWGMLRTPRWQRVLLVTALSSLALYRAYWPLAGRCPVTADTWFGGVCKQSTLSTCSAAAAATALRVVDIPASESEMATLCLTREAGTTNLGLYRGLRIKTAGTAYTIAVFSGTLDELAGLPAPAVLSVGSTYRDRNAWPLIGNRHSVVFLGKLPDGSFDVADPYTGRHQRYKPEVLRVEWDGRAVRIIRRSDG